jgi:hypothetical protein
MLVLLGASKVAGASITPACGFPIISLDTNSFEVE